MASKVSRCIQLWLMLLLCWFVLRSDPVTQESKSESENLSIEKVNLGVTEQEATPPLVSIHHTETIIPDNLDQATFVTRPAIAPATPWDDTLILSTVSDQSTKHVSTEHGFPTEAPIPSDVETSSPIENFQEPLSSGDNHGDKGIEADNFGTAEEDDIKKLIKSLDLLENVERQDPSSELSVDQGGDGGNIENVEKKNQSQEGMELSEEAQQFKIPDDEVTSNNNQNTNELPQAKEIPAESASNPPASEGDEDLAGTQDGLEGTQEDMPSFSEWSQKFLAQEEEKKVQQINEKGSLDPGTQQKKKNVDRKQNNFASVDCGANIPEKNSEAQNAHSILLENKDLYMLNPCSANIWFIVELCDHVHVTSLQLANFEMFSSTVEKFQVSFSTRYPTREWSQLQEFVAKSEKSIQNFTIDPIFAKYIKVEQLSHHSSEHYCPWSLLRVYGNSMVEEYEEHESSLDDNSGVDEDVGTSSNTTEDEHISQGYLQSATDAVLNFVKETAKKLVNTDERHTNLADNTTNSTKYPEDNSSQPLPPKTIVQLMPREDFEVSCHGDSDETLSTCLPGSGCGSTEYAPHSYQAFFEIVHNVCGRTSMVEACFTNFSDTLVGNTTNRKASTNIENKKFNLTSNNANNPTLEKADSQTVHVEEYSNKNSRVDDSTVPDSIVELNEQKRKDVTISSQVPASEDSSTSKYVHVHTETSNDSPVISTVLPSSSTGNTLGSSSVHIVTSSSVTSSIDDFNCSPSPNPLAQPPLAIEEEPDLAEPPTQPGAAWKEGQSSADTPKSLPSDQSLDSTTASTTTSKVSASPTSAHETLAASSIVTKTTTQTAERMSTSLQDTQAVDGGTGEDHKGTHGDNKEHEEYKGTHMDSKEREGYKTTCADNKEHDGYKGTLRGSKEHGDIPNPHVDVLKITLTDAETKEGTAELEQDNQEHLINSDLDTQQTETVVSPVEEGNVVEELVKSNTAIGDGNLVGVDLEKNAKEVETHETDKPVFGKQDEIPNSQMDISKEEKSQNIDLDKEAGVLNNGHSQTDNSLENLDTNIINKDSSGPSERQCEMKDGAISKNPDESSSSNIDPGHTIQVEAVPHATGNVNINGKKESIFVALSRKIKALEQNVTMTNLFLEELSKRYRKSMDEVQRKMEKKFTVMSRNSKLLTKVNLSQNSTILALTTRIQQLEEKLDEATSRLKVVNQEVVERHVLGMCLQFVFIFILWLLLRRSAGKTDQAVAGNGHLKNGGVICNGTDYRQQNGAVQDITQGKHSVEEFDASKPLSPEVMSDTKRRRRRKHRPNSIMSDHAWDHSPNRSQNIVSESAGLLFHSPGSHESIRPATKHSDALRSCSADSLNSMTQAERKLNMKPKLAFSPKSKKVFSRNKKDAEELKSRTCASQVRFTREPHAPHTRLVRSKSSGECYENQLALSDMALSPSDPDRSLGTSRCSLQSTGDPLKDRKSRWIWGLG